MRFLFFLVVPFLLIACSKDKPAPVAPAGKAQATLAAPPAPTNLRFEAVTDSSCRVLWDAVEGATDYDVNYKSAVGGRWTNQPHRGVRLHNTIHDLEPNTEYRWAVRAENGDGASAWVHGPNFTTRPSQEDDSSDVSPAPTNLRFDTPTDSSCTVRWDAVEGATDYDVNYKPAVGGRWTNEPHKGVRLYNTINDLEPNTEYRWAVRAENRDGPSQWVFGLNFTTLTQNQDGQDGASSTASDDPDDVSFVGSLATDRAALVTFYRAMDGNWWSDQAQENWLSDAPLEDWYGVSTDENGRVTTLRIDGEYMDGPIPKELGNLDKLTLLHLIHDDLTGPIPKELGNLIHLRGLYLGNNQLSGPIPKELGNLDSLRYLSLGGNRLSGSIPKELGNLVYLRNLELEANRLSGRIPPELGQLDSLRYLALSGNRLSGSIPKELANLDSLEVLSLFNNQLSGSIPSELARLTKLRGLSLRNNPFSGCIPRALIRIRPSDIRSHLLERLPVCNR